MDGWIKIHRKMLDWEWFSDAETMQLFIACLIKANHTSTKWRDTVIERGSFVTSIDKICALTGQTTRCVRTRFSRLEKSGNLTIKTTNKFSVITVCRYDDYQFGEDTNDNQSDNPLTNKRQTNDKQTTTNKNDKNNKNKKNDKKSLFFASENAKETERENFFEIFFFKNFTNPEFEVERFCSNYEASGWIRKNGQPAVDRIALAKSWTPEAKNATPRFNAEFIKRYKDTYVAVKQRDAKAASTMIHDIHGLAISDDKIMIACSDNLMRLFEQNINFFRDRLFNKFYSGRSIHYRVPKTN